MLFHFFFFKQKTAYEMRISDWSSDVCSSDLPRIATSYGQTETVGSVTFTAPDTPVASLRDTVGRAVPPYDIRIVDEADGALPAGEAGEIAVSTPYGMSGYWNGADQRPEFSAGDMWHRTGDVGGLNESGDLAR